MTDIPRFDHVRISDHAGRRMEQWGLSEEDVLLAIGSGKTIEDYPSDAPFPSRLILGWVAGAPIHVVYSMDRETRTLHVITAYRPDPLRWEPGFERRRRR